MKKILLLGLLGTLLGGCGLIDMNNENSTSSTSSPTLITEKPGSIENKGLTGEEYLNYYSYTTKCEFFPSTGNPKMLVVPVLFSDSDVNSLLYSSEQILSDLDKTFNGTSLETGWESVSTYYQKSSYGKLNLEADVLDYWITLDKTLEEIMALDALQYLDPTWYIVDYVVDVMKNQGIDLTQYDSDSDGFIDGIWIVYGERNYSRRANYTEEETNFLWAYTFWENKNNPVVDNPKANVYCWGSYDFMYEGVNGESPLILDAHTFVHETGHMLGLDDYYDYDVNSLLNPTGCLDMMDYNIGDHNAYSKFLLGWINPQVFNFERGTTYTLNPFESSGDCLLISTSDGNNISPLEEYLFIEYYTPTGLNELDSIYQYGSKYPYMFNQEGIKIYHVDARLGEYKRTSAGIWKKNQYIRNFLEEDLYNNTNKSTYFDIFASNTSSRSFNKDYKLLNLISENNPNNDYYYMNTYAKNKDLFERGSTLSNYEFNDGNILNFEVSILDIRDNEASIFFE